MRRLLLATLFAVGCWLGSLGAAVTPANAQGCGPQNPNCIVPTPPTSPCDVSNRAANTAFVAACASGGSGAVSSVFGRNGAVVATTGDYNFGLISGQTTLGQLPTIGGNIVLGNATGGSATPSALSVPSCSSTNQALNWTAASGFGCVTISGGGGGAVSSVFGRTGAVVATTGDYGFSQISGQVALTQISPIATNTVLGNASGGTTTPSGLTLPSCSGANQALNWTLSTGFGCVTVTGGVSSVFGRTGTVVATTGDYTFAQIGSTPTTLAGYGITSPLDVAEGGTGASAAGATAANNIGALAIASNLSDLASASTARTNLGLGTFATQNFATPPAIGGTTPNSGAFSSVVDTGPLTTSITGGGTQCVQANNAGVLSGTGGACPGSTASVTAETFCATAGTGCAGTTFTPGTTTAFTLSASPINAAATAVMFDGVVQAHNTWSLSAAVVTLVSAVPANTQVVEISWLATAVAGSSVTSVTAADSTLTILPNIGPVFAALNLASANTWTAAQAFPNNSLTLAEFPTLAANRVIGSIAGGTPIALTPTQLTTLCNTATTSLTGCLSLGTAYTWTGTQTFPNNSLTLAEFATLAANRVIGSIAGGTPAALTPTQITTLCNIFTATLSGCVPAPTTSTGKFLRDDATWATVAAGGVTSITAADATLTITPTTGAATAKLALGNANTWTAAQTFPANSLTLSELQTIGANTALGSIAGGTPAALTTTQLTTLCNAFSSTLSGCVPASGGGTTNVLFANNTWGPPPGVTGGTGWFNVKAYGAVGNGTTNDTTAINSAIAAMVGAGNGCLYFPYGQYLVSTLTTIQATSHSSPPFVPCALGDNPYASVIVTNSATGDVWRFTGDGNTTTSPAVYLAKLGFTSTAAVGPRTYSGTNDAYLNIGSNSSLVEFTASISGTVLTVTAAPFGVFATGMNINAPGVPANTTITSFGTGGGGTGTYNLSTSSTVSSEAMVAAAGVSWAYLEDLRFNNCAVCLNSQVQGGFYVNLMLDEGQSSACASPISTVVSGVTYFHCSGVTLMQIRNAGAALVIDNLTTGYLGQGQPLNGIDFISTAGAGVLTQAFVDVIMTNSGIVQSGHCLNVTPSSSAVATIYLVNTFINSCYDNIININPTGSASVGNIYLTNNNLAGSVGDNIFICNGGSGKVFNIRIIANDIGQSITGSGIEVATTSPCVGTPTAAGIQDLIFSLNSIGANGNFGIGLGNGLNHFTVTENCIGSICDQGTVANTNGGIGGGTSMDHFIIALNRLYNGGTGTACIANGSSCAATTTINTTTQYVAGNIQ